MSSDPAAYRNHRRTGNVLLGIAIFFLFITFCVFFVPNPGLFPMLIYITIAIIVGNYAFNHWDHAESVKPVAPISPSFESFYVVMKNGNSCTISIDIQYPIENHTPHTLERIRTRVQRALNIELSQLETLPQNLYPYFDNLVRNYRVSIATEVGLKQIDLTVVDVKTTVTDSPPGIFLRDN